MVHLVRSSLPYASKAHWSRLTKNALNAQAQISRGVGYGHGHMGGASW